MSAYDFIAADKKLDSLEIGVEADGHVIKEVDKSRSLYFSANKSSI